MQKVFSTRSSLRVIQLTGLLFTFVCVGLSFFSYNIWMVVTDRLGTFHNTASQVDLDGDSDMDVLLHNVRSEEEFTSFSASTLWLNQGEGQFVPTKHLESIGVEPGWASAAGDIDNDGDTDLIIHTGWSLRILLNPGSSQEGWSGYIGTGLSIYAPNRQGQYGSILTGDVNNDGWLDIVVTGCCGRLFSLSPDDDSPNNSWVWINDWDSRDALSRYSSSIPDLDGLAMRSAALGDLDGDGDLDLFTAVIASEEGRNTDPSDRVLFNDGAGNFTDSGQRLGNTDSAAVALGDLDGDNDLDAKVGSGRSVQIWINQGEMQGHQSGTFALSREEIPGGQISSIILSDFAADGDLDVLVAERRQAVIWWNDGQASFERSGQRFRYSERHGLAIGNLDANDRPDIFVAEYSRDCRVWLNLGGGSIQPAVLP